MDERRLDWRWVDEVIEVDSDGASLTAYRDVKPREWYFEHHFENFPVVPGVLLTEMMAHAVGYLPILRVWQEQAIWAHYFLAGTNKSRFYRPVLPDSRIVLSATLSQGDESQVLARAKATVNGQRVARAEIMLQRIEGDWVEEQDIFMETAVRRALSPELKQRYGLT